MAEIIFYQLTYLAGFVLPVIIGLVSFKKYRVSRFPPLITMAIGMIFTGSSFLCDFFSRFQPPGGNTSVLVGLKLAAIFFYGGTLLLFFSFFTARNSPPWIRLMIYAVLFGMMIDLQVSAEMQVIFDSKFQMWFTTYADEFRYHLLDILTSLVMVDILVHIIRRQSRGFISTRTRNAHILFWIGVALPLISSMVAFADTPALFIFRTIAFIFGLSLYSFAFIMEPLGFCLSDLVLLDIIVVRSDAGDVCIAQISTEKNGREELKSQALSGISMLLNEIVRGNTEKIYNINELELGDRHILIERTSRFTSYLIGEDTDLISRWGLRLLTREMEEKYGSKTGIETVRVLRPEQIINLVRDNFPFLSKKNSKVLSRTPNQK